MHVVTIHRQLVRFFWGRRSWFDFGQTLYAILTNFKIFEE